MTKNLLARILKVTKHVLTVLIVNIEIFKLILLGPPEPATKIPEKTEEATNDDFVEVDNYVDDYNEAAENGVLPDHGQGQMPYPMVPGLVK